MRPLHAAKALGDIGLAVGRVEQLKLLPDEAVDLPIRFCVTGWIHEPIVKAEQAVAAIERRQLGLPPLRRRQDQVSVPGALGHVDILHGHEEPAGLVQAVEDACRKRLHRRGLARFAFFRDR